MLADRPRISRRAERQHAAHPLRFGSWTNRVGFEPGTGEQRLDGRGRIALRTPPSSLKLQISRSPWVKRPDVTGTIAKP